MVERLLVRGAAGIRIEFPAAAPETLVEGWPRSLTFKAGAHSLNPIAPRTAVRSMDLLLASALMEWTKDAAGQIRHEARRILCWRTERPWS